MESTYTFLRLQDSSTAATWMATALTVYMTQDSVSIYNHPVLNLITTHQFSFPIMGLLNYSCFSGFKVSPMKKEEREDDSLTSSDLQLSKIHLSKEEKKKKKLKDRSSPAIIVSYFPLSSNLSRL